MEQMPVFVCLCLVAINTNICHSLAPILSLDQVMEDSHAKSRGLFTEDSEGHRMPAPAPRLSRTPAQILPQNQSQVPELQTGAHTKQVLQEYGFEDKEIFQLEASGAIGGVTKSDVRSAL